MASRKTINGVMLDPARTIERPWVYRELMPLLGRWGYNLLLWHFIDDQGCAMVFPRRPEIASRHAMTAGQTRGLIRHAAKHGMQVVPEVECFGHAGQIVSLPKYRHLRDGAKGKMFGAMCPFHPDARSLLVDLLTDAAETFDSPFIHVGMDEVGFGDHPLSRKLLRTRQKWELFADHVNWLHGVVSGLGKRMMMWGDHLSPPPAYKASKLDEEALSEKIVDRIPTDIVICDWHYDPDPPTRPMDLFIGKGFQVIACPATSAYGMINHPSDHNLRNLRDFARQARKRRGVAGSINTVWCPYRWFPGAMLYGLALGAAYQKSGGKEPRGFAAPFARETFGLPANRAAGVGEAVVRLHHLSPRLATFTAATPATPRERGDVSPLRAIAPRVADVLGELQSARRDVTAHRRFYDDLVFAASCLHQLATDGPDRDLHRRAVARWNLSRHPDDPRRDGRSKSVRVADALTQRLKYAQQRQQ